MADFRKLVVWQKAHAIALDSYRLARRIKGAQNSSLRSQITRAAQSIAANIVEGSGQESGREFARFLGYSLASSAEHEYHLMTVKDLELAPAAEVDALLIRVVEVKRMLFGLRNHVIRRTREQKGR